MAHSIYQGDRFGRQRCDNGVYPRHRHGFGYICVVLRGHFVEAGDSGRFHVGPGDVLSHDSYHGHMDVFGGSAHVLNLPLIDGLPPGGRLRCSDPDAVAIEAEVDPVSAARLVASSSDPVEGESDWPDLLAEALTRQPQLSITQWSDAHDLAPATVSRGFLKAYGASPARFRAESRAVKACRAMVSASTSIAAAAADLGFADQAHMTRAIKEMSGLPPARLRQLGVKSVQYRCPVEA